MQRLFLSDRKDDCAKELLTIELDKILDGFGRACLFSTYITVAQRLYPHFHEDGANKEEFQAGFITDGPEVLSYARKLIAGKILSFLEDDMKVTIASVTFI